MKKVEEVENRDSTKLDKLERKEKGEKVDKSEVQGKEKESKNINKPLIENLYDYKNPDEERRPWNDPTIIDPKTKKPYDWNAIPHK